MTARVRLETYFPDRSPTWAEVGVMLLSAANLGMWYFDSSVVVSPVLLASFLLSATTLGLVSNSAVGQRIGRWFLDIGKRGRGTVILLFVLTIVVTLSWDLVPAVVLSDIGNGVLFAAVLYMFGHVLHAREISGWTTDRND